MLRNLRHSDNDGTVGWTCIHAHMTADDMEMLLQLSPKGYFVPTFYRKHIAGRVTTPEKVRRFIGEATYNRFYFNFPEDDDGLKLLATLVVVYDMVLAERFGPYVRCSLTNEGEEYEKRQA